jgi:quercetin dioxygenase-like cupin family protein
MKAARINFSEIPWERPNVGVRSKSAVRNGKKLRLVEFTAKFEEHEWCRKGHLGYVLDGELDISFSDRTESFSAGDGIAIARGERHKVKVIGSVARLMLVEAA